MHTLQFLPKYDTCKHPLWIGDQKQIKEPIKVRTEMVYRSEAMCGASGFIYLFLNIYILSVISLYVSLSLSLKCVFCLIFDLQI